jgi:hypothetical protein
LKLWVPDLAGKIGIFAFKAMIVPVMSKNRVIVTVILRSSVGAYYVVTALIEIDALSVSFLEAA